MSADAYGAYLCTAGELPTSRSWGSAPGRTVQPSRGYAAARARAKPDARRGSRLERLRGSAKRHETGSLAWTQASLKEDWPAPVRPEPAGSGSVQPMPLAYLDPTGDTGSDVLSPCVDIRDLTVDLRCVLRPRLEPPDVEPSRHGSPTAWSSTRIATASPTGATGSTTCPARPAMSHPTTGSGARIRHWSNRAGGGKGLCHGHGHRLQQRLSGICRPRRL